jgi:hypothetical protein
MVHAREVVRLREEGGGPWECPVCGHTSSHLTADQIAAEVDGGLPRCGRGRGRGGCTGVLWPGGQLTRKRLEQQRLYPSL